MTHILFRTAQLNQLVHSKLEALFTDSSVRGNFQGGRAGIPKRQVFGTVTPATLSIPKFQWPRHRLIRNVHTQPPPAALVRMDPESLASFFAEQDERMALPDEDMNALTARVRAWDRGADR